MGVPFLPSADGWAGSRTAKDIKDKLFCFSAVQLFRKRDWTLKTEKFPFPF